MTPSTTTYHNHTIDRTTDDVESARMQERINKRLEEFERREMQQAIRRHSPDGRPANPRLRTKEVLILAAGSIVAVLALSGATYALWGTLEAVTVLILGILFAFAANPVIWAMYFRNKEREQIKASEQHLKDSSLFEESHSTHN